MSTSLPHSPSPSLPLAPSSLPLPPTPRDFDIHKMHLVQFRSTRTIAQKHGISQTRIRQIVQRVSRWLAASLPVKTDAELQQETRLAQNLAADQLRHQLEELRILWDATHDPKYFRQQSRVITALARLGIVPGAIEALSADATTGPLDPTEPQPRWSEDDPWGAYGAESIPSSAPETPNSRSADSRPPTPDSCTPPPSEDCSPSPPSLPLPHSSPPPLASRTPSASYVSADQPALAQDAIDGLKLLEQRLLTLLDNTNTTDTDRRQSLSETLQNVRTEQAAIELRLSRHSPPVVVSLDPHPSSPSAPAPVP